MAPHRPFDPSLLDAIEESVVEWRGKAYRQVFEGTDVLRANIRGARWNPPPSARDPGDNLVVFVNNMAPTYGVEPVAQEVYLPTP